MYMHEQYLNYYLATDHSKAYNSYNTGFAPSAQNAHMVTRVMQTPFQRLTLRMTRFYTSMSSTKVWSRLQEIALKLGFETKTSPDKVCCMSVIVELLMHAKIHSPLLLLLAGSVLACLSIETVLHQVNLTMSTTDCRKQPLIFRVSIYELRRSLLLVEFRRSKVSPFCALVYSWIDNVSYR